MGDVQDSGVLLSIEVEKSVGTSRRRLGRYNEFRRFSTR